MGRYFGTDGVRGQVGETISNTLAYKIGLSLKDVLKSETLVIGCDTRESSKGLMKAVMDGAFEMGMTIINVGVISTPVISFYSFNHKITGVMITASHNPFTDNGIKVFYHGKKTNDDQETLIEAYIDTDILYQPVDQAYPILKEPINEYLSVYEHLTISNHLSVGFDSANGANVDLVPSVAKRFGLTYTQIGNKPNGININKDLGSLYPTVLRETLINQNLDVGFAFDGDGDRVIMMNQDTIYDGDAIIYLITSYLKSKGRLKNDKIALTQMSNIGIIKGLNALGIDVKITPVGDKHIFSALEDFDLSIGGENSGHVIIKDYLNSGDGLFNAMMVLHILSEENKTLKELLSTISYWPQTLENLKVSSKEILKSEEVKKAINSVTDEIGDNGKCLVRPSGTEDLIRVTISCQTQEEVDKHIKTITNAILREEGKVYE
jgi:phosphoglucosamine mutase